MGVTGLWRLIEPSGKPVPVETLENKVLAVDISIWLHQMVKGYQDAKGAPLPNAHLMGLFQRLCKLLYFRIKPVFVFDGGFPDLKKETIAKRQDSKAKYNSESERIKRELALLLSKKTAISSLLGKEISPKKSSSANTASNDDLFKLPALPESKQETESESEDEESSSSSTVDLHSVDIESNSFKTLPVKEKYDLLIELKETRKMNSWGRLNELPKQSDNFSDFQMQRLLKRRKVQECLEETEKEMGDGGMSLNELESLLNEEGIDTKVEVLPTRRIASNDNTRFLLINNVKQALLEAKKKKEIQNNPGTSKDVEETGMKEEKPLIKDELEEDLEKAIKMSLECSDDHDTRDTSNYTSKTDDSWTSVLTDTDYSDHTDSEEGDGCEQPDMTSAKAYIMQYSDLTNKAIDKIISSNHAAHKNKSDGPDVNKIIEDINKEKSIIVDKVDLSSDEEYSKSFDGATKDKNQNLDVDDMRDCAVEIDSTQASVMFIENPVPEVVTLDTSGEDSTFGNRETNIELADKSKPVTELKIREIDMYMYNENPVKIEKDSSDDDFENVSAENKQKTDRTSAESNSSDDEFEDVPDIESQVAKPVVQLTLDMDQKIGEEDDIFADIFTNKIEKEESSVKIIDSKEIKNTNNCENKLSSNTTDQINKSNKNDTNDIVHKNVTNVIDVKKNSAEQQIINEMPPTQDTLDEDLERAIKMSLECVEDHDKSVHTSESDKINIVDDSVPSDLNTIKSANKDKLYTSDDKEPNAQEQISNKERAREKEPLNKEVISTEKLNEMAEVLANEEQNLVQEKGRLDRVGRNITEQMTKEAQELLQLFGIPYIVAPMEAEAQCAFLEDVKLTDGTITDDSDIWLFGGKTVYKNFFNQKKHVLQFLSERIEKSFNLSREQLILLALLVGSDYTTGVDGVGPVTAMEILASFPFNKKLLLNETSKQGRYQQIITGMQEFKSWVRAGKRTDNTTLKKKLRNVKLNDDFPSVRVVQAYLEPNVEKNEDKFSWGEIDITILRDYTKAKFGWSQNKLDEILKPVLKRLQERKSQKTMQDYFRRKVEFQSLEHQMSKRVKAAVQKMGPETSVSAVTPDDCQEEDIKNPSKPGRKRKANKSTVSKVRSEAAVPGPSRKVRITTGSELDGLNVKAVPHIEETSNGIDIIIPKTDRFQEIIPQREKDKQCLLQNKMKAIELFRKTKIDRKKKITKRKVILPKDRAELSESSDGD